MKIKEIRLKNFKAYKNPDPIKFSCDCNKKVTLIYGVMGAGKTSLFEAINWGLYGNKVEGKDNTIKDMSYIAGKYLSETILTGQQAEVSVEIDFEHEGSDYYLTRIAFFKKINNKLQYLRDNDKVKLHVSSETLGSKTYNSQKKGEEELIFRIISNILPFSSRDYFLFDGEKLDKFSSLDRNSEIKNAIRQVLGLTDLENAKENFKKVQKELSTQYKKIEEKNKDVALVNVSIEGIEKDIGSYKSDMEKWERELINVKAEFNGNEQRIDSFKEEREKINKRKDLERELETNKRKLKIQRKNLRDLLTSAYSSYSKNIMKDVISLLNDWQKEGKFPAEYYNLDFINKILYERKCFFWGFEENSKEEDFFKTEAIRLKSWDRNTQEQLTKLFADSKEYLGRAEDLYDRIKNEHQIFVSIQGDIETLLYDLSEINKQIKSNITDIQMKECEEKREKLNSKKNDLEKHIELNKDKIRNSNDEIGTLRDYLFTLSATTKEGKILKKKLELVSNSLKSLERLHEYYAQIKRKEVELLTKKLFQSIFWKKTHFDDVGLSEDYKLTVADRWDSEGRETFSAGEREVLSLSFVAALAKSSSKDAPFIIDTPFARISSDPTNNIANFLPEHLGQLIVFVTDKELTKEAEELFLSKSEYIWTIMFDQETSTVKLLEGKHVKSN